MKKITYFAVGTAISYFLSLSLSSAQVSFQIYDLGTLGGNITQANAINASGQMAGTANTSVDSYTQDAFLASVSNNAATIHNLDSGTFGGSYSSGTAINASGQVTGYAYTNGDEGTRAFLASVSGSSVNVQDLGTLGGNFTYGEALNDFGQVVGESTINGNTDPHAFLASVTGGTSTILDLGTLGGTTSFARSVNDSGQITGSADISSGSLHAFVASVTDNRTTMHDLGTLGGATSLGQAINASGQVTGVADTANGLQHAFSASVTGNAATMHDLGTLGGSTSNGFAINASGQVTGFATTTGNVAQHAFLANVNGGTLTMQDLGTLGGTFSEGTEINSHGDVIGASTTFGYDIGAPGASDSFLFDPNYTNAAQGNHLLDLGNLLASTGWSKLEVTGLNDSDQISGYGTINGQQDAFRLDIIAVPEPPASDIFAVLFLITGIVTRGIARRSCAGWSTAAPL